MEAVRKAEEKMKCDICGTVEGNMWLNPEKEDKDDPTWLCANHMVEALRKQVDTATRLLAFNTESFQPSFPIAPDKDYQKQHPGTIPGYVAELAFSAYRGAGGKETMPGIERRGGFTPKEMDRFYPPWMTESSEITSLRNSLVSARMDLVERDQEIYILNSRLRVMAEQYEELAEAIGWTKEYGNKTGESPKTVARAFRRDVETYRDALAERGIELSDALEKLAALTKEE